MLNEFILTMGAFLSQCMFLALMAALGASLVAFCCAIVWWVVKQMSRLL
jgi:hypothetical protein